VTRNVLVDQNIQVAVADWLRREQPTWTVHHTAELGMRLLADESIAEWAAEHKAIIITLNGDFADLRRFPLGSLPCVIRVRVFPTTVPMICDALSRMLREVREDDSMLHSS